MYLPFYYFTSFIQAKILFQIDYFILSNYSLCLSPSQASVIIIICLRITDNETNIKIRKVDNKLRVAA